MGAIPQANSNLYWGATFITALLDLALVWLLIRQIQPALFRKLRIEITVVSTVFWGSLWAVVMASDFVWKWSYRYVFSPAARWYWPVMIALAYGGIGHFFWWLALRVSERPVVSFLILGGLISFPGHIWAIFARKIMETPLLQKVSVNSALTFGFFEFIFYWCLILILSRLAYQTRQLLKHKRGGLSVMLGFISHRG